MEKFTYPVFLVRSEVGLANADTEAVVADCLVWLLSHWLAPVKRNVSSHLRSHGGQREQAWLLQLLVSLVASEGGDWQLEVSASGLRHCSASITCHLLIILSSWSRIG